MIVGGYSLQLYCDNESNHLHWWYDENTRFPLEYTADGPNSYQLTRRYARREGWILKRDGTCICPICNKKIKES